MTTRGIAIAAVLLFSPLAGANAGTIVTAGLPSGSAIINIDGRADGAATYGGPNADAWYQPFSVNQTLLEYTVQPGTYAFRVVDQADAALLFPALTPTELGQIGGAWTYNSPWATDYLVFDVSAASDGSQHQLFAGAVTDNGYGYASAELAYQEALDKGYYDEIVTGSGRYTGSTQTSYTFPDTETLIFAVPDYALSDNAGTVSVLISPVPEPSQPAMTLALLGGLAVLAARRHRPRAEAARSALAATGPFGR